MIHVAMVCAILMGAGQEVKDVAASYRVAGLEDRRFNHTTLWQVLEPLVESTAIGVEQIGRSIQGREIRALHFGQGSTRVLLWSQMHGDESTATMALVDITRFLVEAEGDPLRERLGRELTITMVPMLNPDGAERFTRRNAIGVDINRDARQQATPEGRALKTLRDRIEPQFGFNLHDQEARKLAGESGEQVAIALLAPAADEARTYGEVRSRARLVAATIVSALEGDIAGHIAKYDDGFTPRAFGDLMQSWGTSTVLIESGAIRGDIQKQELRRLNVIGILEALDAIATGSYRDADPALYEGLPENDRIDHDIILRGGKVVLGDGPPFEVDVGLWFEDPVARDGARLGAVGDLADAGAIEAIDASGLVVHVETFGDDPDRLQHDEPVFIEVLRPDGTVAHSFGTKPR
ncbi:MAG: hypothetical protein BMS9Abin37_1112 [Acidobacteriota bacterium]|nr:MAG: hypothetical protein BMS9Abin37_1112 [Acidobacteriota bacterium]